MWLVCVKACRGNELDDGMETSDAMNDGPDPEPAQRIPIEADFIYAYSTTPGLILCVIIVVIRNSSSNNSSYRSSCGSRNSSSSSAV